MSLIIALANKIDENCRKDYYTHLLVQQALINRFFPWITCKIRGKILQGHGVIEVGGFKYNIDINYSPFLENRFDRIYVKDSSIAYNDSIHLYSDMSLCLYHPIFDRPLFNEVSLFRIIPWISEWCVFYNEWKKYKVWLGKEIKH